MPSQSARYASLDLIRAIAIGMIIICHSIQMLPVAPQVVRNFGRFGQYGIDVFFVLSGFLVGRLFWQESKAKGKVDVFRFYMRRAMRTMPPYFVALVLSYLAVKQQRDQEFLWQYLFFLQNYLHEIPFFLISWSLCIEEHFYLFLPIFLTLIHKRLNATNTLMLIFLLALLPLVLRNIYGRGQDIHTFGYLVTATHFRFEGLLMGVGMAYVVENYQGVQVSILYRRLIYLITTGFLLFSYLYNPRFMYHWGYTIMAALLSMTLLLLYFESSFLTKEIKIIKRIAISSYSVYLTHALSIHAALKASQWLNVDWPVGIWLLMLLTIAGSGMVFYHVVEKPSIRLRNQLFG